MESTPWRNNLVALSAASFLFGAAFQPPSSLFATITFLGLAIASCLLPSKSKATTALRAIFLLIALFLLGGMRARPETVTAVRQDIPVTLVAKAVRQGQAQNYWEVQLQPIDGDKRHKTHSANTWLFPLPHNPPTLPGDLLEIRGKLERRGRYQSLHAASWRVIGHEPLPWLTRFRSWVRNRLGEALPPPEAALATALLLGERSGLDEQHRSHYRQLGLLHLLAVSGMHLWLWNALMQALLPRRLAKARLPLLLFVAAMAGFQASVVRACSALILRDFASRSQKNIPSFTLWGSALWCELLLFPDRPAGLGILLSYSATAGILFTPSDSSRSAIMRVLLPSYAAFLATAPLLHEMQGTLEPWSIPLTPVFGMTLAPRLLLSLATLLPAFHTVTSPALVGIRQIEAILLDSCAEWPASPWIATQLPSWLLLLCCACALYALNKRQIKKSLSAVLPLFFFLPMPGLEAPFLATATPSLLGLPVGHGLAVVIAGTEESLLFDFGSQHLSPTQLLDRTLIPELKRHKLPPPNRVIYSHQDADHVSGAEILQNRLAPIVEKAFPGESVYLSHPRPWSTKILGLNAADPTVTNNRGVALEVTHKGGFRAILLGDASGWTLKDLENRLRPGPIDLLLLPHHGLTVEGLGGLLDHLRPRLAWASCSQNDLPFPAQALLEQRHIPWKTTADGSLYLVAKEKYPVTLAH